MEKRGLSHVEVILSFILFIVAVGFALYFFSPSDYNRLSKVSLEYGFREILENTSVEVESYSVKIIGGGGFPLSGVVMIDISGLDTNWKVRAEKDTREVLPSARTENKIFISNTAWNNGDFIYIRFSEDFVAYAPPPATEENTGFDEIASSETEEVISEKRFLELNKTYYSNYLNLKKEFNLPDRVEIGFSLVLSDKEISAEKNVPAGLEVFSEKRRVEVLKNTGEMEFADLIVRVW